MSTALVVTTPPPLQLLRVVGGLSAGLSAAAAAAIDTNPQQLIERWLKALSPTARRSYARALRSFSAWALTDQDAPPESALRILVDAGAGRAHAMVCEWRDHLLGTGLAPGTVASATTGICS